MTGEVPVIAARIGSPRPIRELTGADAATAARLLRRAVGIIDVGPAETGRAAALTGLARERLRAVLGALAPSPPGWEQAAGDGHEFGSGAPAEVLLSEAWAVLARCGSPLATEVAEAVRALHRAELCRRGEALH